VGGWVGGGLGGGALDPNSWGLVNIRGQEKDTRMTVSWQPAGQGAETLSALMGPLERRC
jgi:hypothetical protein